MYAWNPSPLGPSSIQGLAAQPEEYTEREERMRAAPLLEAWLWGRGKPWAAMEGGREALRFLQQLLLAPAGRKISEEGV